MNGVTPAPCPAWLVAELRSDHAGETGAVMMYGGILAVSRDTGVRAFAVRHQATEQGHLGVIDTVLPAARRSRLTPLWRLAGWLTGALPALAGPRAVYATIDAVETFVDRHYRQQIARLDDERIFPELRARLEHCRQDEVQHRDEARGHANGHGVFLRAWCWLAGTGSAWAVAVARRV
jgi:ubiquinone biosynthesis monooxygenase Coq7